MTTITVYIILNGLIALVPGPLNSTDGVNHMTALVVDARIANAYVADPTQNETHLKCLVPHYPKVEFPTSDPECDAAGCALPGSSCTCDLEFEEISIEPDVETAKTLLEKKPRRIIPFDRVGAVQFAYLANLSELGQSLDRAFLESSPPPSQLVARFKFPFTWVKACNLGTRLDDNKDNVHVLNFRPLQLEEKDEQMSQAVAQQAVAKVDINVAEGEVLRLNLKPFAGGNARTFKLGPGTVTIRLTNERGEKDHFHHSDEPCDDGVGRDFAFFYELVNNPPIWMNRPVPHVKPTMWKRLEDLEDADCRKFKNPLSRPICPMATFIP